MTALPRFYILGGFLGAGKTTTLLHLARRFHEAGRRVGLAGLSQSNLRRPVSARLTLNARAHCATEELRAIAEAACDSIFPRFAADVRVVSSASFRPGRPVPIHRDPLPV